MSTAAESRFNIVVTGTAPFGSFDNDDHHFRPFISETGDPFAQAG